MTKYKVINSVGKSTMTMSCMRSHYEWLLGYNGSGMVHGTMFLMTTSLRLHHHLKREKKWFENLKLTYYYFWYCTEITFEFISK